MRALLWMMLATGARGFVVSVPRRTTTASAMSRVHLFDKSPTLLFSSNPSGTATDPEIYNCHIHLCGIDHIPPRWPSRFIRRLGDSPFARNFIALILRVANPFSRRDKLERYANFLDHGGKNETALYRTVKDHYPPSTHFVVLPMDLRGLNKGEPKVNIRKQHQDLADLVNSYPTGEIIPFIHIDPRIPEVPNKKSLDFVAELHERGLDGVHFKGIKLYPPLGYDPNDGSDDGPDGPCSEIFHYANEKKLPVMVHCSDGGMFTDSEIQEDGQEKQLKKKTLLEYTAPKNYKEVLKSYPNMRLCLAHFGGDRQWDIYKKYGNTKSNWVTDIKDMIKSDDYPNLYTDISYTMFYKDYNEPLAALLREDPRIQSHVLFGSDYYMSEHAGKNKDATERSIDDDIRNALGDPIWWKIAHDNPKEFLGIV